MFTLTPEYFRPGLPYVFAQEVQVDAADQVLDQSDRHLDMVEMVIMVQGTPTQEGKPTEQGARIVFNCVDYADPRGKEQVFAVMWVVAMGDMLSIARLPDKHIMRVVAQPCISDQKITKWLVTFSAAMAKEDVDAWRARKIWQKEIAAATPKKKMVIRHKKFCSRPAIVLFHMIACNICRACHFMRLCAVACRSQKSGGET